MVENIDNSSEEIVPPLPKGFTKIKKQETIPPLPEGFTALKKKESTDSTSTTTPPKLASGTPTGSSGGKNSSGFPEIDMNGVAPGNGVQPKYTVAKPTTKTVATTEVKYKEGSVAWNHQKMIENNPDYVSNYDKFKQVKSVSDAKKAEIAQDNEDEFNGVGIWNNVKSFGKQVVNSALQGAASLADVHPDDKKDIKIEEDPFADQKAKAKKEFQDKVILAKKNKETVPVFTIQDINQRAKEIKLQERIDSQSETQIKDFLQKDNETGGLQKNRFQSFEIGNYATIQEKDKVLLEQQNIERNVIKGLEGELKGLEVKLTENGLSPENLKVYKEKNNSLNVIKSEYDKADSDFKNSDQYKNYVKKSEELKPIDAKYKSINADLEKYKLDIEDAKKNKDSKKESELITIYNQKVKDLNAVREQYNTIYDGIKDNSFIANYNKNIEVIRSRYNNAYKEVNALSKTVNRNNKFGVEYNEKYKKYKEVLTESIATHDKYVSNRKNLGSATENLDIFKRDYGSIKSFIGNVDAVMGDLAGGVVGVVDYALEAKKNILGYQTGNDIYAQKLAQGVAVDLKADSDKVRSEIMKPIAVENINNLSDLGDWFFQTAVAQQVPIFGLIATGGFGVGAIGVSSGGGRLNDMRGEMERGEKQYTDNELMIQPVGFAITETASAAVDLMILKNAARVISSATRPERQMIANGFAKRVMKVGGAMGKGGIYEGADEGLTKGGQNLIEGRPFMEGMVDPIAAGSVMGLLIPFGGHLFAEVTKPFSTDTKIQEASAELLNLQKELDKSNLSTETRELIKDNLAKTQVKVEALMKKQIKKIESLSKEQFQEILKNEKTQANIKQQAEGVQLDESISTETKKQLLANLKAEFKAQNERRMDLLARGASVQMERLDPAESIRLKDLAAKRLMQEQNPDGTKSITLEDEEISRTAIQIYNAEVKESNLRNARDQEVLEREKAKQTANEQNAPTPTPEAQPQAEVPQPSEAQKVDLTSKEKITALETELESIKDDNNPRIGEIDKEISALENDAKIKEFRAEEQTELKAALPNAELKADGKIDVEKLSLTDAVIYDDIYAKYDKLITPLLENEVATPTEDVAALSNTPANGNVPIVNNTILELEKQRDAEIESLKSKRQYDEKNIKPIRDKYKSLILIEKSKETEAKIKNKNLFLAEVDENGNRTIDEKGNVSQSVGEMISQSDVAPIPTSVREINGIEFVEFSNPKTEEVDVIVTGTSESDYVGFYRIYENGKPTDKWSSKLENQSRNKEGFKTMIGGVQSMLPEGHQYTEKTSISTDGLRVWEQQLSRGYELQTDENGSVITSEVAINGDAIVNELGIDVNQGNFDNISVTNNQQFQSVKKALLPYLQKFGLNESNIRNVNGTVEIDLPVLRKTKKGDEATPPTNPPSSSAKTNDYKKGSPVIWEGKEKSIKSSVKMGNDIKYEIDLGNGKSIWTNKETLDKENAGKEDGNIVTDGNVRPANDNVGEVRATEQEIPAKESVPGSVDGGEVKGDARQDVNIDDVASFLDAEFGAKKPNEIKETHKPKKEADKNQNKIEQAKGFVSMAVSNLTTSLKDFQGRAKEYSEQTYNRIVNEAKEGTLNISSIPPIQIWKSPDTGKFVILAGHSRTKAFSDLASGKIEFSDKYNKSDFTNVNAQIVEAETLEEAQKIAKESNQGAVQTEVDNAKYTRESLLPTFKNKNQAATKLRALYGKAWNTIYAYAHLNPRGKVMQLLGQVAESLDNTSNQRVKNIAQWVGNARAENPKLTDAHENEMFDYLLKNDKIQTGQEFSMLINSRVNGLTEFNINEPLNFEQKVGRGSNEVEIVREIQDLKSRDNQVKKQIKDLQAYGKNITDAQRKQIKDLTAESIKINTVDIPNAQVKQKQARVADAEQFDIFSQINEQVENGNITPEKIEEFVNDDRRAEEIEPIVEAIESQGKNAKGISEAEIEKGIAEVNAVVDDSFNDKNLQDNNLNDNLAINKTDDGQEFLSLSEPNSEYSNSSQLSLWGQGDTVSNNDNSRSVRAVWTKYKNLQFKGTTKIKNAEDVAKIMSLLENKSVEHAFAIHIDQKGNSHIQFLSIGGVTGTVVDTNLIAAGVSKFNSVKVYLVHNHPSGNMRPSEADKQVTKTLRDGLNPLGIVVEHVIMDTYKKEYVHIDNDNEFTVSTRGENTFKESLTPIALTEQEILGENFGKVTSADKAFSIIQNFRFSAMPKNAMLVLDQANNVIGNYVFSNEKITYKEILKFVGETGIGRSVIFYGNQADNLNDVKDFQKDLTKLSIQVFDKIVTSSNGKAVEGYYESMANSNLLNEHQEKYGTGNEKFNELNEPSNKNSQTKLIDLIANAVKNLISVDVDVNDAIKQVVASIKAKFGDIEIDIKAVEERVRPKESTFESKAGKKSLLGRLIEGGNPDVITKAVEELGENYDVRNQQEANDEAMAFIDKVGASEALKAIKDGLITNSDVKMLIYDEALTRLKTEISDEMDKNPEDREALIKKFQEVSDDFDNAVRDAGQGIAILNFIYNKNQTLKYNLKKQIADWKRNDPNGEIPAEIKAKFEELDQKLKDLEEKTKEAEARAKKAEDGLALKNIQEDVERKNQEAKKNKSGLTPQEQSRKNQLRDKFARANDVTGIPALLVDPEFREYLGLVLKTAKGDFANFSNEILKELGKSARQYLPELFANAGGKGAAKVTDLQSITIDKKGKIKIPAQLLRDYVEQGYTDIDEIAALIKDDIADEFPDVDVRDIRDALTGYGKQINPNKDEITAQVSKLKEYGRLLSAYDDVMNGQMPLKSGLTRPKPEQKARELRRNINRLAKELNLEQVDTEKQWANAIDKVKTQLKNQIEDLDKQIANGEKRKIDKTPIRLDEEATALKSIRDAKKQILDDLVGKPELTEEQKITNAEKSLETSIKKIQEEINTNDIAFKEKPTAVTSKKIEELKAIKKALLESKKQLRQEAGLIEQQRLKTTKTRIKKQIEDLNNRIKNKDFAKKEIKPIIADSELNTLRAEKEAIYEEYEKMKYLQELKNRTFAKKLMDEGLEALGLARAIKASLDLGLIGIQLRGFTYSELWRNPKELGRKFVKMFEAIGSQNKANKAMSELIGDPDFALAKKLDIGITNPDLRNEVREEMASGNLLHFIWSSPVLAAEILGAKPFVNSKRTAIGDSFINSAKTQYNKLFKNYQLEIKQKEKFSIKEQWRNINAFEAVERGLSAYGNRLRFEEFKRGIERLRADGKDEINHLEDYKLLASYIRTFSGRAKPAGFELNQKALNVFFFSFKNMASVVQQLNPIYYGLQHVKSTDFKNENYFKPSVANKMAMATMFKSVASTSATLLFVMAAYNAFKDDDEEEAVMEKDPRSSDFGKLKIGNFRYDPWGGYIPLISLYARLATEEVKKADGTVVRFGEGFGGIQNRGDAASRFLINKESPGFQMFHKYMTSTEEVDKVTGETYRATPFGEKLSEEDTYSFYPIFLGSVKSAKEKDYEGVQAFLTGYSVLGLGNVQEYESKKGNTPEDEFLKSQAKKKAQFEMPNSEKDKIRVDDRLSRAEGTIKMIEEMKIAKVKGLPYYISKDAHLTKEQIQNFDFSSKEENIKRAKKIIAKTKLKYGITE